MNSPAALLATCHPNPACQICGENAAHGRHFGVEACRACAAFFRRTTVLGRNSSKCVEKSGNCRKFLVCRFCRLKKCVELGMSTEKIRLEEPTNAPKPVDLSVILQRSTRILGMYYMCQDEILEPLNALQKLTKILKNQRGQQKGAQELQFFEHIDFSEIFVFWEFQMTQTAEFLMYMKEFRDLPFHERVAFFKIVWAVWRRFERFSMTAEIFGQTSIDQKILVQSHEKAARIGEYHVDYKAVSSLSKSEIRRFFGSKMLEYFEVIVRRYVECGFEIEETTWILTQICWIYAARRLGGQTLAASEIFLAKIGDDLHEFYKSKNIRNYAWRIGKMMKIVNEMLNIQVQRENSMDVMLMFNFFNVPEYEFFRV